MTEAEVAEEYESSLQDLKDNSKPMINMLTMLAEECKVYAGAISKVIEKRILKFAGSHKLSPLYLLDSIIKNVGNDYIKHFKMNIAEIFSSVFQLSDEKTRKKMYELRQTWNGVFPNSRLYQLDSKVRLIDPNWPKTDVEKKAEAYGGAGSTIHVNPNVIKGSKSLPKDLKLKKEKEELIRESIEISSMKKEEELIEQEIKKLELSRRQAKLLQKQMRKRSKDEVSVNRISEDSKKRDAAEHSSKKRGESVKKSHSASLLSNTAADNHIKSKKEEEGRVKVTKSPEERRVNNNIDKVKEASKENEITSHKKDDLVKLPKDQSSSQHLSNSKSISGSSRDPRMNASSDSNSKKKDINTKTTSVKDPRMQPNKIKMNLSNLNEKLFGTIDVTSDSDSDNKKKSSLRSSSVPKSNLKKDYHSSDKSARKSVTFGKLDDGDDKTTVVLKKPEVENLKSNEEEKKDKLENESKVNLNKSETTNKKHTHVRSSSEPRKVNQTLHKPENEVKLARTNDKVNSIKSLTEVEVVIDISVDKKSTSSENKKSKTTESPKRKSSSSSKSSNISNLKSKVADTLLKTDKPSSETFKAKPPNSKSRTHIRKRERSPEEPEALPKSSDSDENIKKSPPTDTSLPDQDSTTKAKVIKLHSTNEEKDLPPVDVVPSKPSLTAASTDTSEEASPAEKSTLIEKVPDTSNTDEATKPEDVDSPAVGVEPAATVPEENLFGKEDVDLRRLPAISNNPVTSLPSEGSSAETEVTDSTPKDSDMRIAPLAGTPVIEKLTKVNANSPNSASWESFRNKNPDFKKYLRMASESEDMEKTPKCKLNLNEAEDKDGPSSKRLKVDNADSSGEGEGNKSPETEASYNNFRNIVEQVNDNFQRNEISECERLKAMSAVHVLVQKKNIEELKRQERQSRKRSHEDQESSTVSTMQLSENDKIHMQGPIPGSVHDGPPPPKRIDNRYNNRIPKVPDHLLNKILRQPETKTILIDGVNSEIRTYGHIGIILFSWNDPRVIRFLPWECQIVFDNYKFRLNMNSKENYKNFTIDGEVHKIKLGLPTQEIFLDKTGYQCMVNGQPIRVRLAGKPRSIALCGDTRPAVDIGKQKNTMFLAGKVQLTVNAKKMWQLYLDARPQHIRIKRHPVVLKFIDSLRAVLINGIRFPISFGGLPISVTIGYEEHYLSFSALPEDIIPGDVGIIGMTSNGADIIPDYFRLEESLNLVEVIQSELEEQNYPPPEDNLYPPSHDQASMNPTSYGMPMPNILPPVTQPPTVSLPGLDTPTLPTTSLPPTSLAHTSAIQDNVKPNVENLTTNTSAKSMTDLASIDINSLMQSLYRTGIIGNKGQNNSEQKTKDEERDSDMNVAINKMTESKYLKKRKQWLVNDLYSGIQCSACGLRFLADQTAQYSQHLDWHFRQNKKQQDSTRKPNARKWYFSTSDWTIFEEIEDIDERVPSMFESENNNAAAVEEKVEEASVPQSTDNPKAGICLICHDAFPTFFHQEKEEWHYRNAITVEGVNYHPQCYEDKMKLEEAANIPEEDPNEMLTFGDILEISVVKRDRVLAVVDLDDDDDDEDAQYAEGKQSPRTENTDIISVESEESKQNNNNNNREMDAPIVIDDSVTVKQEQINDALIKPIEIGAPTVLADLPLRKIKIEVEDDDDVEEAETTEKPLVRMQSAKTDVFSSIDGNTDLSSTPENSQSAPTSNKIKISISAKSVISNSANVNGNDSPKTNSSTNDKAEEDTFVPPPFSVDYSLKPGFKGVNLKDQDKVETGFETSNLCSIM